MYFRGGGWENPLEREPEKVLNDVLNEFVSMESALHDYGVVIDPETLAINEAETKRVRTSRIS
ncbi:hypothetical protein [Bacillus glycinifermentans]|uniref:hypothetical protein n=1 Tax=Bacillus glycinifermentans TaxID=1664069 RepID=UPI001FF40B43|nr:hypothetical protein [Bacillus glycinifermentans]MEC3609453.1 hypothetical protein [Bacillus glycinifermentans]UOY89160.1 hypothetical protein MW696_02615 [Bacillus glycinifermentans]